MKRSVRLQTVVKVARRHERRAADAFTRSQQQVRTSEDQLDSLLTARRNYLARLCAGVSLGVGDAQELYRFVQRLDEAIDQLRIQIRQQRHVKLQDQANWLTTYRRVNTLTKVVDRTKRNTALGTARREQQEIDDLFQKKVAGILLD